MLGVLGGGAGASLAAPRVVLQPVAADFEQPVYVTHARDGTNRLFVVEQAGRIKVVSPGATGPTVFLDITARVLPGGERGLLGLAFHPRYATTGRLFVNYTRQPDGATVVAEYRVSPGDPDVADTDERSLLVIPQPFANHNGGMIEFGPDGLLYVGTGDGGASFDPDRRAQDVTDLLGKILRIDVDTPPGSPAPYASPPGNPFAGPHPGRDEIYALGFRNPWRFSFDRATGALYVGDVGQDTREEIDVVIPGGNYGWPILEGRHCLGLGGSCADPTLVPPAVEYAHASGRCSVTGGYAYRGNAGTLPAGAYTFSDLCSGEIFLLEAGVPALLLPTGLAITSFGEDEAGEIHVTTLGGGLHRLVNPDAPTLALGVDPPLVRPGETLRARVSVRTGDAPIAGDAYFGIVQPDGRTVVFLTGTRPAAGVVASLADDARTFAPLMPDLAIPAGTTVTIEDFFVHAVGPTEPSGPYVLFVALARDGALDDGRVDPGDLLAVAAQTVTLGPAAQDRSARSPARRRRRVGAQGRLRRTSSSGADQGYGSIASSAGSATRGPIALGQMYSQIGPNRTRSWMSTWIWWSISSRLRTSVSRAWRLKRASTSGSAPTAKTPSFVTRSTSRVAALPYCAVMQEQIPRSFLLRHAVWKAARSMVWNFVRIPTAAR
jgi:glucose/arabinose dehydrogenase